MLFPPVFQTPDDHVPAARPSAHIGLLPAGVGRPAIDGDLGDAAWEHAGRIADLRQVEPVAGAEPSERTEVLLLRDERAIFVALRCDDREPERIRATQRGRDAELDPDDRVEMLFDPFLDRRNAFWFQIGAAGSLGDALIARNGTSFNKQWDAIWHGRARITARGWQAEIEIPAASINFDPLAAAWGFNVRRFVRRRSEEARWAGPDPRFQFFWISHAGTLEGFGGMRQERGLDLKPFAVADWIRDSDGDEHLLGDAGADAIWRLSPSTKVNLSLNTDFAETEVDERQVNLTRFPLFFPEKRDFFLEDSSNFVFGPGTSGPGGSPDVLPFFSRRIGLDAGGEEVPILAAAKVTGRTEGDTWGVLGARTDETSSLDAESLFVGRYSRNVGEQSDVGAILTAGDPQGGSGAATYGADFNYRTGGFLGDRNLRLSGFALATRSEDPSSEGEAWHLGARYPNDEVELSAAATWIEEGFDPALGFVKRTGVKKYEGRAAWRPRLNTWIRQLELEIEPVLFEDEGNDTETVEVEVQPLGVVLESGDELAVGIDHRREVLDADFDIHSGVVIPEGGYTFTSAWIAVETSDKRPLSSAVQVSIGEFFDGERVALEAGAAWRASALFNLGVEYELDDVDLPAGDFQVNQARLRASFHFSPDVAWSNFLQWDDDSEDLGLNSRLWWILEPGREVFFVVNQGWEADSDDFHAESSQVTLKLGTTVRL